MKLFLCVSLLLVAGTSAAIQWKNLHLTWGLFNGFYKTPLTLTELLAQDKKYTFMVKDDELNVDFYSYPEDPRVAVGFDSFGNIAAVRYSIPKADMGLRAAKHGLVYNYTLDDKPLYRSGNFWNTDVYYSTAVFDSPETLAAGGRKTTDGIVGKQVYLPLNGVYTPIPNYECDAPSLGFTKGGCFDGMGIHYILGMSNTMACEDHQGPFLLYEGGDLVGLGWFPFGTFTTKDRLWFEDAPSFLTKVFAPDAPDCFEPFAANFGVISFHIMFKQHPRLTICSLGANKSVC